jgi:membrane protein implicated in regulation of membrane protease activity
MVWWAWVLVGLGFLAAEAATPGGFFALFFGLSAVVVGGLTAVGLAGPAWVQWVLFSALSILALATLRGPLKGRLNLKGTGRPVDSLAGEVAIAQGAFEPGGVGKVELRGTSWNARSTVGIGVGQRLIVERVDGLTLWVRPE